MFDSKENSTFRPVFLGIFASLFLLIGCDNSASPDPDLETTLFERTNTINDRIRVLDQNQNNVFRIDKQYQKRVESGIAKESAINIQITPVVQVDPPPQGNFSQIAASHLHWDEDGGQVYISYIVAGNEYGGGFDMIDEDIACYMNNPPSDCNSASFITNQFDVGAVATSSQSFYAAGAVNSESTNIVNGIDMGAFDSPAAIFRTPLNDIDAGGDIGSADLSSFSATDVTTHNGNVYAVTGAGEGELYRLSADLQVENSVQPSNGDLRSIALSNDNLFMLNGNGEVSSTSLSSQPLSLTALGDAGAGIRDFTIAKMSYSSQHGGRLYVPLNDGGFSVLDAVSGQMITEVDDTYYSSVTVGNDLIYAAASDSSSGGLVNVYQWDTNNQNLIKVGSISVNGVQANLIKAVGNYLFVANDEAGVRILEVSTN